MRRDRKSEDLRADRGGNDCLEAGHRGGGDDSFVQEEMVRGEMARGGRKEARVPRLLLPSDRPLDLRALPRNSDAMVMLGTVEDRDEVGETYGRARGSLENSCFILNPSRCSFISAISLHHQAITR